jgi:hypothetical protein
MLTAKSPGIPRIVWGGMGRFFGAGGVLEVIRIRNTTQILPISGCDGLQGCGDKPLRKNIRFQEFQSASF